jgi:hypothetical protein
MNTANTKLLEERARFMSQPLNKLVISTLPPGNVQEAVKTLLEAAFLAGFTYAQTETPPTRIP